MSLLARYGRRASQYAPWRRLWVPRGQAVDEDGTGFLAEPAAGRLAVPRNRHLRPLDDLDGVACLVALGDPGLGKSWELDAYVRRLADRAASSLGCADLAGRAGSCDEGRSNDCGEAPDAVLGVNAAQIGSVDALRTQVWEADATLRWRAGRGVLHLVLDGLDEAPMALGLLCDALLDGLESLPVERLRLRVGCRTAVFPHAFREGLTRRFASASAEQVPHNEGPASAVSDPGAEGPRGNGPATPPRPAEDVARATTNDETQPPPTGPFLEVELVPLRREDVRLRAEARFGSPERAARFLEAVLAADAGAFAARPQTLDALLDRYGAGTPLAAAQAELYRTLCTRLCNPRPVRPGTTHVASPRTTVSQRYQLAGRIAAAMLLGNRPAIWMGAPGVAAPGTLAIPELTGPERAEHADFHADESALWEAVDTGVFTGGAATALATHQTFAEFLAAEWITARALPLAQVRGLLTDPADPEQRVVPQLRQLAAWVAALRPDVFDAVARTEPDILLWSDVVQLPPVRRPALVGALLAARTANRVVEPPYWSRRRLAHLEHPGLAAQLAPVLADRGLPERTRDLALDLAWACRVAGLAEQAADLALDATEPLALRVGAASLVASVGSDVDRLVLALLLDRPTPDDPLDDLRGVALRACWRLLTPEELFSVLTPPKRANHGGLYGGTLLEIAGALTGEYAAAGASWLARASHEAIYVETVAERALRLALDASADPAVAAALGAYVVRRLRQHQGLLGGRHGAVEDELGIVRDLVAGAELRRRVIRAVVGACPGPDVHLEMVAHHQPYLFMPADVPWALEWLAGLPAGDCRRACVRALMRWAFDAADEVHVKAAFAHPADSDVAAVSDNVATGFATPAAAVAHAERHRARLRAQHARREAVWARRKARQEAAAAAAAAGPLPGRVAEALTTPGDADARWWAVFREVLRVDARHIRYRLDDEAVAALRGLTDVATQVGVTAAAAAFLRAGSVPEEPYPNGSTLWTVVEAIVAFVALHDLAPAAYEALEPEVWQRWMRTLVGYWATGAEETLHAEVLGRAAAAAPEAAREELLRRLDAATRGDRLMLHDAAAKVAPSVPGVAAELSQRVARGEYPPENAHRVLEWLVRAGDAGALTVARQLVRGAGRPNRGGTPGAAELPELVKAAGAVLLECAPGEAWAELWSVFRRSDAHARALLAYAARDRDTLFGARGDALTPEQLGDMYQLIERLYPPETDPVHVGMFSPGPRDNLSYWRGAVLRRLEARNTTESVAQLERLARREPVRDWLVQVWLTAQAALRGSSWRGTAPRDLMALAVRADARVVESSLQLLTVVVESLARLQVDLQGQWRSVVGLWNEATDGSTPKSEEHLSNEVARHLKRDLVDRRVVIGRELRVQLGTPGGAGGLRTDVEVYAPPPDGVQPADEGRRVIIEVKGSWNPELLTAMRAQLVERYLAPHGVTAGLYLVGWYTCPAWKRSRQRAASERHGTRVALQDELSRQAEGLSTALRQVHAVVLDTSLPAAPA